MNSAEAPDSTHVQVPSGVAAPAVVSQAGSAAALVQDVALVIL